MRNSRMGHVSKNRTVSRFDTKLLFPAFTHILLFDHVNTMTITLQRILTSNIGADGHGMRANLIMHKSRFSKTWYLGFIDFSQTASDTLAG